MLWRVSLSSVMPGLVPGIHVFGTRGDTWMAETTSPAMTCLGLAFLPYRSSRASLYRPNSR